MKTPFNMYQATFYASTGKVLFTCEVPGVNHTDAREYVDTFLDHRGAVRVSMAYIGCYQEDGSTAAERATGVE